MTKLRISLSLLVIAGAVLFAIRHRSLRQLQDERTQLQHPAEESANRPPPVPATPEASASEEATNCVLSPVERSELLRLRGQVAGLRQEIVQETNRLAEISRTRRSADALAGDPIVTAAQVQQKMAHGRQWLAAIVMYAQTNRGELPATLADAAVHAGAAATNDDFELVPTGKLRFGSPASQQRTIVLREKKPWRGTNRRWNRTYVFVDGHSETATSTTTDFTEWEEKLKTRQGPGE